LIIKVEHNNHIYKVDMENGCDLSIKNKFSGNAPIFYDADQPKVIPQRSDGFIGDIKYGGSCNVPIVSINIHCTGTHTECISHISDTKDCIVDVCPKGLIPAFIITIKPENANTITDSYHSDMSNDFVISRHAIKQKISQPCHALIIRTLPNDFSKLTRNYDEQCAPFLTNDAVHYINELGVEHLLVDVPSIDKANDGGKLGNHRLFFNHGKTISELLYVPDVIGDGFGFLQIHIPNWKLDSAPSRPIFYPV